VSDADPGHKNHHTTIALILGRTLIDIAIDKGIGEHAFCYCNYIGLSKLPRQEIDMGGVNTFLFLETSP